LVIGDFNNDHQSDIGITNSATNNLVIFLGHGNGYFGYEGMYLTDSYPTSGAVGDFNNDTQLDIVVANFDSRNVGVFLGYGNGSFANQTTYVTGFGPQFVSVGDFNNDTFLDIVVAIPDNNNIGILLGYGNGSFADLQKVSLKYGSSPFMIGIGDFNNDRKLDFAVANEGTDSLSILLQTC
jgi:hypothetical protein